ncbi:DUF2510 domain-containing protein [Rhodococcus kronopolitis]|uniref:DUF2510 domain-containing protein n=1 Tax=Rhodococcus kronopolitis TaxID=1460226 RepID=A0ABV9FQL6_9NOCA
MDPTVAPGWYPDPEGAPDTVRWWDGAQWTSGTRPVPGAAAGIAPTVAFPSVQATDTVVDQRIDQAWSAAAPGSPADLTAADPGPDSTKPKTYRAVKVVGGVVGMLVGLAVFGAVLGDDDSGSVDSAAPTTTRSAPAATSAADPTTTTAAPTTTASAASEPTTTSVASPSAAVANAVNLSDPRCAAADPGLMEQIASGLTNSSLALTNGLVIVDGPTTFVGATTVRPDGKMKSRSDVWVVQSGQVYSSTGGARNETSWPRASREIDIDPGDDRVEALDRCVVDVSKR